MGRNADSNHSCRNRRSVGAVGDKAKDLYDTAQLEENQFNKPHATNFTGRS